MPTLQSDLGHRLKAMLSRHLGLVPGVSPTLLVIDGWERDSSRRTVLAFRPGGERPEVVAKIGLGAGRAVVDGERRNLEALARTTPELRASVPRVLEHHDDGEGAILLETAARGVPLERVLDRSSLSDHATRCADWYLRYHLATRSERVADDALVEDLVTGPLRRYVEHFQPADEERSFLLHCLDEASALRGTPLSIGPQHGDFCPANVLVSDDLVEVIDWETPFQPVLPGGDLIHLLASLALATGTGTPLEVYADAFFEHGAHDGVSSVSARLLPRFFREAGLDPRHVRLFFTVYWAEYALEKVGLGPHDWRGSSGAWGLAELGAGTCLNVRYLARNAARLVIR